MAKKIQQTNLSEYYQNHFYLWVSSFTTPLPLVSPLDRRNKENRKKAFFGQAVDPSAEDFEVVLGIKLKDGTYKKALEIHQRRFRTYHLLRSVMSILIYLFIGIPMFFLVVLMLVSLGLFNLNTNENIIKIILYPLLFVTMVTAFGMSNRITYALLDRSYADTLSFVSCLYLVINLMKEHVLIIPPERKQILTRIRGLEKYLVFLSYQYAGANSESNNWANQQFKLMKYFVKENEWRIIAPLVNTHTTMINEMQPLVEILLTGNYGEFKLQDHPTIPESNPSTPIWLVILKIFGILTPMLLLIGIYFFQQQFQILGFDNKIIALISLAWFLLAIDINLKLGIVDRVSGLAKAFRELQ